LLIAYGDYYKEAARLDSIIALVKGSSRILVGVYRKFYGAPR
jgi:hypothetical protein